MSLVERQIKLAFEQELDGLRQRTQEGIETARRNGKQIGGHKPGAKIVVKKREPLIRKHSKNFRGSLKDNEVIAIINATPGLKVSRNTYYKYKWEAMHLSFMKTIF